MLACAATMTMMAQAALGCIAEGLATGVARNAFAYIIHIDKHESVHVCHN